MRGKRGFQNWRRGRDSNPGYPDYGQNGFRDRRIQPLCHPSAWGVPPLARRYKWRRDRDSNPRYAFGAHTISNRAPSASSVISPLLGCARFARSAKHAAMQYTLASCASQEKITHPSKIHGRGGTCWRIARFWGRIPRLAALARDDNWGAAAAWDDSQGLQAVRDDNRGLQAVRDDNRGASVARGCKAIARWARGACKEGALGW